MVAPNGKRRARRCKMASNKGYIHASCTAPLGVKGAGSSGCMGMCSPRKSLIQCVLARPYKNMYVVITYSIILNLSPRDSGDLPHPASFGLPIWQTEEASQ